MRSVLVPVLVLSVAAAGRAGDLDTLARFAPPEADTVAALALDPVSLVETLASWSLSPKTTRRVMLEHLGNYGKASGLHLDRPLRLLVAGNRSGTGGPLLVARISGNPTLLGRTLAASRPGLKIQQEGGRLTATEGDLALVMGGDGLVLAGARETVKQAAGRGREAGGAGLTRDLKELGLEDAALILKVQAPEGIPEEALNQMPGDVRELAGHLVGLLVGLSSRRFSLALELDRAEAVEEGQSRLEAVLDRFGEDLGTAAKKLQEQAVARGASGHLDPTWIGARVSVETYLELRKSLAISARGRELRLTLEREAMGTGEGGMLAVAAVGVLAAIAVPNFQQARIRANFRACYANQKTIAGATEMYNLDKNTNVTDITPEFLAELQREGYLQSVPQDPGQGPGSASHYVSVPDGNGYACTVHGDIGGTRPGTLPPPGEGGAGPALAGMTARMLGPLMAAADPRSEWRACFANQKTIAGATEMYNLDKNTNVTEINPAFLGELQGEGYLQSVPQDPGQGESSAGNYYLVPDENGIACRVHGSILGGHPGSKPRPAGF